MQASDYHAAQRSGPSTPREPIMATVPHYRPLYRQVYDFLVKQIADAAWRPAQALPSEQALAEQLKVSPGTVRKALDALATEGLVERRQGKGTFVAEQTQERALFRFFRLAEPGGARKVPSMVDEELHKRPAKAVEQRALGLGRGEQVYDLRRTRAIDDVPVIYERCVLPVRHFPALERRSPLPNALYAMFQRDYGIHIVHAEEELRAELATAEDAARLGIPAGTALLHVERVAIALDERRVEWRSSRCDTSRWVYAVTLS